MCDHCSTAGRGDALLEVQDQKHEKETQVSLFLTCCVRFVSG